MKHDELTWLATELGLSVLDEAPLNAGGSVAEDEWLVERLRSALGGRAPRAELARALMSVRAGRPMVIRLTSSPLASEYTLGTRVDAAHGATRALVTSNTSSAGPRLLLLTDAAARAGARDSEAGEESASSLGSVPGQSVRQAPSLESRAHIADAAAAMAHEVANATSAIAGWARLASTPESGVSPDYALGVMGRAAETANQAARRLLRLARGDGSEALEPIDASATTDDLVALLGTVAREANVRLSAEITPKLWVLGSVASLFTVVWNLAKNAIEASGTQGSVHLQLTTDIGGVVLRVRDTGPGLSMEARSRIFEKYVSSKATGTGLGLPLVQSTVHALGGQIAIESELGRGSTFSVRLPQFVRDDATTLPTDVAAALLPDPPASDFSPATPSVSSTWPCIPGSAFENVPTATRALASDVSSSFPVASTLERVSTMTTTRRAEDLDADILIVEDDDPLREMMSTVLRLRGARVTCARNIHEARNVSGRFDIALIDLALDECRGDELLASLRRRGIVSAAMLVTGSVQKPRIIAGGEPDDWVRKPFEITELVERIQRILARHSMLRAAVGRSAGA